MLSLERTKRYVYSFSISTNRSVGDRFSEFDATAFMALAIIRRLCQSLQDNMLAGRCDNTPASAPWPRLPRSTHAQPLSWTIALWLRLAFCASLSGPKQASDRSSKGFLPVTGTAQLPTSALTSSDPSTKKYLMIVITATACRANQVALVSPFRERPLLWCRGAH